MATRKERFERTKKRRESRTTPSTPSAPSGGTIAEFVSRGGILPGAPGFTAGGIPSAPRIISKPGTIGAFAAVSPLPGAPGFDIEAVKRDVQEKKRKKIIKTHADFKIGVNDTFQLNIS